MLVNGQSFRSIWVETEGGSVNIIDQTKLPHEFVIHSLATVEDAIVAITDMQVRGAPLIGATAAYGICLGLREQCTQNQLEQISRRLISCRPTAINLQWAVERLNTLLSKHSAKDWLEYAYQEAALLCEEDCEVNKAIGNHGAAIIERIWQQKQRQGRVDILTHCNAGWLATVDWGTALAPVYKAAQAGIPVHVWVDETRPRNQGAHLTAWELQAAGIDHHLVVDNAGGHLMQRGMVDLCIVGTDRTAANGDVCNKIGTYLKALAAADNNVPFYVALPGSTIDWATGNGVKNIPIEERGTEEVLFVQGRSGAGTVESVEIAPQGTCAYNPAFDVTPAHLVAGLITERGVAEANSEGLLALYPEKK
ncbi:S-methyl-5-thioribose-1-phosphate isomerase [Desulfogranum marinum]|jgi:methylthioribose-1-phosphate isomerase|uniref:S-methyl-5-thioribose-1-phosphate isomerase n=1 Tax=Desulfogranum marinum TaxID=453220 RepID=UPI0019654D4A|nr:S-methyl-5-thioribose-1-phosphate isomerase [Desulfogranum marinum]MBM9510858.1 S-methyl-5-thioribose-1-phosphate isomerase [Desulfogranum marinum]